MDAARFAFPGSAARRRAPRARLPGLALTRCAAVASALAFGGHHRAAGAAEGTEWALAGEPLARKEALEFSGAACAPDGRCLLVGDEGRRARLFTLAEDSGGRPKVVIGAAVALVPAEGDGEADAEAAAFDRGRFYVVGSHGTSRRRGERQPSRYSAYRIEPDGGRVVASGALSPIVGAVGGIREAFCPAASAADRGRRRPCPTLQNGGANIEGLAVRDGTMHVGFRAPSPGGRAFVVSVPEQAVFGQAAPAATVSRLALGTDRRGRGRGVRDLAAVAGGFLVLAGPALPEGDEAKSEARVFFWPGPGGRAVALRRVGLQRRGVKPEALLVLGEDAESYRVLVIHDGVEGGAPTEHSIRKPRG